MHTLKKDEIITAKELQTIFSVSNMGGMRSSKKNNCLILIHKINNTNIYNDEWKNDILYYTGMGLVGDQKLTRQNKILAEANNTNIKIYLFETEKSNKYQYKGEVKLVSNFYIEKQKDKNNCLRNVYIFPLKIIE